MDDDDFDIEMAVIVTMSNCIRKLAKCLPANADEKMQSVVLTAATICLSKMVTTQTKPAQMHSINGGKLQ